MPGQSNNNMELRQTIKPKYLIQDNDRKFGPAFKRVVITSRIEVLKKADYYFDLLTKDKPE